MPLSSKLPLKKKINTVHNLITFSIIFTNKNGGWVVDLTTPPPSIVRKFQAFDDYFEEVDIASEKLKIMFFIVPGIIKTDYLERI